MHKPRNISGASQLARGQLLNSGHSPEFGMLLRWVQSVALHVVLNWKPFDEAFDCNDSPEGFCSRLTTRAAIPGRLTLVQNLNRLV